MNFNSYYYLFFPFISHPFLSNFVLWFFLQNLWFQFLIIMVWRLGGRHNSIQLCISYLQGNYAISLISDCFYFVYLFSWTNKSLVAFDAESTKLCFKEFFIHIFYLSFQWLMQHKGIIGFPFFYFLRILISDIRVFFFFFPPCFIIFF